MKPLSLAVRCLLALCVAAGLELGLGLELGSGLTLTWGVPVASAGPPRGALSDSALEPAARAAAESNDWAEAESLYRELVRRQPRNAAAKRELGVALMRQNKSALAESTLTESLELQDNVETRLALASHFISMNRYPSALPHLRRAVALDPQYAAAWVQLAGALVKVDKPDGAADVLTESARVCKSCRNDESWQRTNDEVARALATRAQEQIGSGNAVAATRTLDVLATLNPHLPEGHLGRGQLARTQGDEARAFAEFRKAVDTSPDAKVEPGTTARLELARLLTARGQGAEARTLAQEVVASAGENVIRLDVLGRACEANQDNNCARKAYGRLLRLPGAVAVANGGSAGGDRRASAAAVEHARDRLRALKHPGRSRRK